METIITNSEHIESAIKLIIDYVGDNSHREGVKDTPQRIIRMFKEIFKGYDETKKPKITTFENEDKITNIIFDKGDYYSMCEHHMLPFFGQYYFAYIPKENGRILGISKVARVVDYCSSKLQLQERLAIEIVEMISKALNHNVQGIAIVMKGKHLCKSMRGIKNDGNMSVSHFTGVFNINEDLKKEFYKLIDLNRL